MPDFDAVVIGAGNGGLTSSLALARNDLNVLLLERHNIPGGCATTFMRGRFEFEVALHQLSGMGTASFPGPLRSLLSDLGVLDKIDFVQMDNLYRATLPGQFDIILPADKQAAAEALKNAFPDEAGPIDRFFDFVWDFCSQWVACVVLRDSQASREKYPIYFKYALKTTAEVFDLFFKNPFLKTAIGMYWSYIGLPPSQLSFADFAVVLWVYTEFKPFHIKGGSQSLSTALLSEFYRHGGQALFNCAATKIIVRDGRIRGVETEDGRRISCDYVISNAGTIHTYVDLMDNQDASPEQYRILGGSSIGPSAFTCYIGFDCEPGQIGVTEGTNFITATANPDKVFTAAKRLEAPKAVLFSCYDIHVPDFSPPGACQAALVGLQYAEPWLTVPPTGYAETKYRLADEMLTMAETVFPGLRSHIEEIEVATPLTHMRYLGHIGGAIYGFEKHAKDSNMFLPPRTPVKGLYIAGAWAGAGGFQPTLESGVSAARALLRSKSKNVR